VRSQANARQPAAPGIDTCSAHVSLWHFTADHGASLGRARVPARGTSARDRLVSASQRVRDADRACGYLSR
jgi:hypothetical protein